MNLLTDIRYCSATTACGTGCAAGEVCSAGTCSVSCQAGLTDCSGVCTNTDYDPNNCLSCGTVCGAGELCSSSGCVNFFTDAVIDVPFADMDGGSWDDHCGLGEYYHCDWVPGPWGPTWTDLGPILPTTVTIELYIAVNTGVGVLRNIALNGTPIGTAPLNAADGSCSGGPNGVDTFVLTGGDLASYVVGGVNAFQITRAACEGSPITGNPAWGGAIARVSIAY